MSSSKSDNAATDEETLEQLQGIQEEGKALPLISGLLPLADLLPAYADNPGSFVPGIHCLAARFSCMRKVRGDGNCFYRALLFSYLELLLARMTSSEEQEREEGHREQQRFYSLIETSKDQLVAAGYDEFAFEMFYDEFVELLSALVPGEGEGAVPPMTAASLLELFTGGQQQADCYTWYMRLLTAGYLIKHHERFSPFVITDDVATSSSSLADAKVSVLLNGSQGDAAMRGYCQREVEPMGKESEQLHVIALTEMLGLRVSIQYLDGRPFDEDTGVSGIQFEPSATANECSPFVMHLLYRPGHYDILYADKQS